MRHRKKILVVDDEFFNVKILKEELTLEGYDVVHAAGGEEALRLAVHTSPDAVLLDMTMPGMDGFETCARLKKMGETKDIPVIMLTTLSDTESKYKGLDAGAVDFLKKPVDMLELSIRLKNTLDLKAYRELLGKQPGEFGNVGAMP